MGADGFVDVWIRKAEKKELLQDLWNERLLSGMRNTFKVELVPLNKVWPNIPQQDQFRPIAVESPLFKFLELRFLGKLNTYLSERMDKNQIGFVKNCSC